MKIQPVDPEWAPPSGLAVATKPPAAKSRLKRLFERQFPSVLRITGAGDAKEKEREPGDGDPEPSSVCLAKMVQNFLEENNDSRHTRSRCNCFNGNRDDCSDDELDLFFSDAPPTVHAEASDILKSLVLCATAVEQSLLADVSRIVEKNKIKAKDDTSRRIVVDGLITLGYNASTCKSTWEKTPSFPAGEYQYIDVILDGGERVLLDIDFRSEFEIARPNKAYRAVLQMLPVIFVGKLERLQQVVALACEAARQSMKKKGLHIPPWRKYEYIKSKWLSSYRRGDGDGDGGGGGGNGDGDGDGVATCELDLRLVEKSGESPVVVAAAKWELPAVEPKAPTPKGVKVVTGLASIF